MQTITIAIMDNGKKTKKELQGELVGNISVHENDLGEFILSAQPCGYQIAKLENQSEAMEKAKQLDKLTKSQCVDVIAMSKACPFPCGHESEAYNEKKIELEQLKVSQKENLDKLTLAELKASMIKHNHGQINGPIDTWIDFFVKG